MDLLTSGPEQTLRPPRRPRTWSVPPAAVAGALALVLAGSVVTLVRFGDDAPRAPVVTALRSSDVPEALVGVGDTGTRVLRASGPAQELIGEPLRNARQLGSGAIVGMVGQSVVALSGGAVTEIGPAEHWAPARGRDQVWLVRDRVAFRYDTRGRQLGFRTVGAGRLRGEVADGLVVDDGAGLEVRDPKGLPVRTLAGSGGALDVTAGRIVHQPDGCATCPLQVDADGDLRALRSTSDPHQLRNPDSVRLSPDGRFLAYTRLLSGEPGPLSVVAEVVVVDVAADRLQVLPRSEGADYEAELVWVDRTLLFVRRLGSRLVVSVLGGDELRTGEIAVDTAVDDVVGALAAP